MRIELTDAGRRQYPNIKGGAVLMGWETMGRQWQLRIVVDGDNHESLWHPSWWQPAPEPKRS